MNQNDRILKVINLAKKLDGTTLDRTDKLRGTTVERLCEFDGPGYKRIVSWYEKKILEKHTTVVQIGVRTTPIDIKKVREHFESCLALMVERNDKYGDSWKVLTIPSIANLIEMKLHRVANLPPGAPKVEDEFMDSVNYALMALLKLKP